MLAQRLYALRSLFLLRRVSDRAAATGVVPMVILLSGFTIIAIIVVVLIDQAVQNKAVDASRCVENSHSYHDKHDSTECSRNTADEADNSFTKDEGYVSRY